MTRVQLGCGTMAALALVAAVLSGCEWRGLNSLKMPGTEGKSRKQLDEVVARVHEETVQRVLARELSASDAPAYEWRRVIEELKKS